MALYARVENGVAVEKRDMASPPPAHKSALWLPVVDAGEPSHEAGQRAVRSEAVSGGNLVVSYAVEALPADALRQLIKAEAQRRIIVATGATDFSSCMTKQLNAVMRATELTNKKASGGTLTEAETLEAAALSTLAATIKSIRAKSDALKASMPTNFTADSHWQ